MQFTDRDVALLGALSTHIRLITVEQAALGWWPETVTGPQNAADRLKLLVNSGYLARLTVLARPLPEISRPVVHWSPGEYLPDFGSVAWRLQKRWQFPARQTTIFVATARAAGMFGGHSKGALRRQFQAGHDLGVTQVYVCISRYNPSLLRWWIGEDCLAPVRRRQKLPDAVLSCSPDMLPYLVLEFGGAYDKTRVQDFHEDCEARGLPYEIW